MHHFKCEITIRFDDSEVIEWLVNNEEIGEDEAENYKPTDDECQRYAWYCVENEYCEYGGCEKAN